MVHRYKKNKPSTSCSRDHINDNGAELIVLEINIWKEIPIELLVAILARLPISAIARFRLVCRKWKLFLTCKRFSLYRAGVQGCGDQPWFYMIGGGGAIYDPHLRTWHNSPLPKLPSYPPNSIANKVKIFGLFPAASANGLVCLSSMFMKTMYVGNPMTPHHPFKELPPPPRFFSDLGDPCAWMIPNESNNGYKIIKLYSEGSYEVFDSIENSWILKHDLPLTIQRPLTFACRFQSLVIDSTIYFMCTGPDAIVSYDSRSGVWKQVLIPLPLDLKGFSLVECRGEVMLVGLVVPRRGRAVRVCLWKLQKKMELLSWKEVDTMPKMMCLKFYGDSHVTMSCFGNRGLLLLALRSFQKVQLVTYDSTCGAWQEVPACMLPGVSMHVVLGYVLGKSFHPSLTASA